MVRISRATSKNRRPASRVSRRRQYSRRKPRSTQARRRACSFFADRCAPKRDDGGILTGPVHREPVANGGRFLASGTNMIQLLVPALDIPPVGRLPASRDGDVTIFREGKKRTLAGQWKWRCPVWRKPHEAFSRQIEGEHCCSVTAVKVEIEERETQRAVEQKTMFRVVTVMQNSKGSFKPLKIGKWRLRS